MSRWIPAPSIPTTCPTALSAALAGRRAAFAAEMQMNHLAEALGMDPVEIRLRNVLREGLAALGGHAAAGRCQPRTRWWRSAARRLQQSAGAGERAAVRAALAARHWLRLLRSRTSASPSATRRIARQRWSCTAARRSSASSCTMPGRMSVRAPTPSWRQMAAEAIGVPVEKVEMVVSDTALTDNSGSASASRMTFMAGNSIKGACEQALRKVAG